MRILNDLLEFACVKLLESNVRISENTPKPKRKALSNKVLFISPLMAIRANQWAQSRDWNWWFIDWKSFKDGTPNVMIANIEKSVVDKDVTFLASFDSPEDLLGQLGVIYAIPRYGARSLKIVLPFFPTATMERVDSAGQIATAMTLARVLSATPLTKTGPAEIHFCDPHSPDLRFYFGDTVLPKPFTAMSYAKKVLESFENPAVVFPDEGARKRFSKDFAGYDIITCGKHREGDSRRVTVIEGLSRGKDCLIVDDLIQTGGTLLQCREALRLKGARSIGCFATHGVFSNDSWKKFTPEDWSGVWLTDSCPITARAVEHIKPFHVLSIADILPF